MHSTDRYRTDKLQRLKAELDEMVKSLPAHSLSARMALRIEEIEEEISELEKDRANGSSSD